MRSRRIRVPVRRLVLGLAGALSVLLTGCELTEVTSADAVDVVVVEALLQRRDDIGFEPTVLTAFLHRTIQGEQGLSRPVPGADVRLIRADGRELALDEVPQGRCVAVTPIQGDGTCYEAPPSQARGIQPGEEVRLEIRTAEGERMEAVSIVPGAFSRLSPSAPQCRLAPRTTLDLSWTRSVGAWAYVNETELRGLREGWADLGIPDEDIPEPLDLLGLSISASDTTIVFPSEFGVFDRGDLAQRVALELQEGLPPGARATVSITAVDRNYVNWVRGGSFNPSGQVRIPSVRGDGTGFFGTGLARSFDVIVGEADDCRGS